LLEARLSAAGQDGARMPVRAAIGQGVLSGDVKYGIGWVSY